MNSVPWLALVFFVVVAAIAFWLARQAPFDPPTNRVLQIVLWCVLAIIFVLRFLAPYLR